ncbi:MAG: thiamine phosphate synthase [Prevotella sp.]|nr:thiamine phosphate synthase [Prevotella sp.]
MKIVLMTKSTFFVEEDKILTALFDEGLDNLHLNKPGAAPVYTERLLTLLPDDIYGKTTVHEHFYLKEEYGLRGIHLDDASSPLPEGYKGKYSRTCFNIDDIREARRKTEYVFLKDTFAACEDAHANELHNARLERAASLGLIDKKVYAFGGVNIDNIRMAKDLGFGGIVICSDIWNKFDIHHQRDYKELISHFERIRKAAG